MTADYIIDVSEANFQKEVLTYSQTSPVVVDFWAHWCLPCRTLSPLLEKLAEEGQGAFRLAKLNVDDNSRLAQQYQVSSLPAVKAFHNGKVTAELTGLRPEPEMRRFLRSLVPNAGDLAVEKGLSLYRSREWLAAAQAFRQALQIDQDRGDALLGLAKSELAQGNASASLVILTEFPACKQYPLAERLLPLAENMADMLISPPPDGEVDANQIAFQQSLRLVGLGNLHAAADGLLDILRQDKQFLAGQAKMTLIAVLELMDETDDETRAYRSELSSILF